MAIVHKFTRETGFEYSGDWIVWRLGSEQCVFVAKTRIRAFN